MYNKINILLIEDNPADARLVQLYLTEAFSGNYSLTTAQTLSQGLSHKEAFDVVILDLSLPDSSGMDTFVKVYSAHPKTPVIVLTGYGDEGFGINAVKQGAADFLNKNKLVSETLKRTIVYCIERKELQNKIIKSAEELEVRIQERTKELKDINIELEQELSKRKRAEEHNKQLTLAINKTDNAIIIADKTGKIEWVNEGYQKLTGYTREEVKYSFADQAAAVKPNGFNSDSKHFCELMETRKPVFYEVKDVTKTGKKYWVLTTMSPILDSEGNVEKIIAISSDISKRKEIEDELMEAKIFAELAKEIAEEEKNKALNATLVAENAVKAKQQFLSNMSHEIRTPMNAIIGFTNVLLKTDLSEQQKKYLLSIKTGGDGLIVLINDILDLAKVNAGKISFEQIPFKIGVSISAMLFLFETKAEEKGLKLIKEYDNNIPDVLVGDSARLHQIILNLLSNSLKFTTKGEITVRVNLLSEDEEKVTIEFAVSDTGIGIREDKIDTIFENFQQATNDTSRLFGGTGLGLAIVKELIERQGGSIHVKSKLNEGSTFSFKLSFQKTTSEVELETAIVELDQEIKGIKVLVAEDNSLNQLLIRTILDDFGFERDVVADGKIAIEKLSQKDSDGEIKNKYDIILMDLQMPVMGGVEATEYIRNTMHSQIPILALTADVASEEVEKCIAVGMNDYISKPIDERLLYSKIVGLVKHTTV